MPPRAMSPGAALQSADSTAWGAEGRGAEGCVGGNAGICPNTESEGREKEKESSAGLQARLLRGKCWKHEHGLFQCVVTSTRKQHTVFSSRPRRRSETGTWGHGGEERSWVGSRWGQGLLGQRACLGASCSSWRNQTPPSTSGPTRQHGAASPGWRGHGSCEDSPALGHPAWPCLSSSGGERP